MIALPIEAMSISDTTEIVDPNVFRTPLTELTDREYPNNPDKKFRSKNYTRVDYNEVVFNRLEEGHFDIAFLPMDKRYPKVTLEAINLMEFIPTI